MKGFVLDASALLAFLADERGKEYVAPALHTGTVGAVNLSEVVSKLRDRGLSEDETEEQVRGLLSLGCKVSAFGHDQALLAGHLRSTTKPLGLSLGDRACLALGIQLGLPVLTADHAWEALRIEGLTVVSIR